MGYVAEHMALMPKTFQRLKLYYHRRELDKLRFLSVNEESFCGTSTLEVLGAPLRTLKVDRGRPALYSAIVARV